MKVTLEPTGRFETVSQPTGCVRCRVWEGTTASGAKINAYIPLIGAHVSATSEEQAAFEKALQEVKAERHLVSIDNRMVL